MPISKDLLLAILALDSYNQGYGSGIEHGQSQVGPATRLLDSEDVFKDPDGEADQQSEAQAAGFYAIAYEVDGDHVKDMEGKTTVISYRGTEFAPKTDRATDVAQGWALAA